MSGQADMGGPAFPNARGREGEVTLWDYFAAAALPAFIAHPGCPPEVWAKSAADQADAMLKERAKRAEGES